MGMSRTWRRIGCSGMLSCFPSEPWFLACPHCKLPVEWLFSRVPSNLGTVTDELEPHRFRQARVSFVPAQRFSFGNTKRVCRQKCKLYFVTKARFYVTWNNVSLGDEGTIDEQCLGCRRSLDGSVYFWMTYYGGFYSSVGGSYMYSDCRIRTMVGWRQPGASIISLSKIHIW